MSYRGYRKLYKLAAWQQIRRLAFVRDLYTCRLCECSVTDSPAANNLPNQAIGDHIKEHRGDGELFFNVSNVQTLCKRCHDSLKQSEERLGYSKEIGLDGWPVDPRHPTNI